MLIALAGLPASGKSTLAGCLAAELGGVILSKDAVRATLFPDPVLDYSAAEDDITMEAIYSSATYIRKSFPERPVIIDGRTFLRPKQIDDLFDRFAAIKETLQIIECICSDDVALKRLERDQAKGQHPAKNRTFALRMAIRESAVPIALPHLTLDTGATSLDECVRRNLEYLIAADQIDKV
jgi:predicted kinase